MNKKYYKAKTSFQNRTFGQVEKGDTFEKTPQSDHMYELGYFEVISKKTAKKKTVKK